jgi:hypothetical protein
MKQSQIRKDEVIEMQLLKEFQEECVLTTLKQLEGQK